MIEELPRDDRLRSILEPAAFATKRIYYVYLDSSVRTYVRGGPGRADIGKNQVIVVPNRDGCFGRQIRRSIRAYGSNECQPLLTDNPFHIRAESRYL